MANEIKYGTVEIPGVPDDEPVFIVRAQDVAGLPTIHSYAHHAVRAGCRPSHEAALRRVVDAFVEWQHRSDTRVKVPDTP